MAKAKKNFLGFGTKTTHYRPRLERVAQLRRERWLAEQKAKADEREWRKEQLALLRKTSSTEKRELERQTREQQRQAATEKREQAREEKRQFEKDTKAAVRQAQKNLDSAELQLGAAARGGNAEARAILAQYRAELADAKAGHAIRANPGLTGRFKKCVAAVSSRGGAYDPKAVCAAEERRKYGQKALTAASVAGKKRATRKRGNPILKTADGRKIKVSRKAAKAIKRLLEMDSLPGKPRKKNFVIPGTITDSILGGTGANLLEKQLGKHFGKKTQRKTHKSKTRRRNPEAESSEMYELFHGKPAESVVEYESPEHEHLYLWCVGDLAVMNVTTIHGDKWAIGVAPVAKGEEYPDPSELPIQERVVVAANEEGTQLFFVSGNQEMDPKQYGLKDADIKDNTLIGVLTYIVYQTRKGFDKFELTDYGHKTGEDSGVQPMLVYHPRSKALSVVGGQYRIKKPGIIN
jgi:hypothetical protein